MTKGTKAVLLHFVCSALLEKGIHMKHFDKNVNVLSVLPKIVNDTGSSIIGNEGNPSLTKDSKILNELGSISMEQKGNKLASRELEEVCKHMA